ncbi:MAG: cytochrome b/b6 domain-containing protein [Bacteroidales bacterium]|nr:MAG: cytochrome b/b6 domain-containing protein [Bacteroidales bacterium]
MYLYPKWIRLWHLLNALFCLMLIITGLCLQYSGKGRPLIPFDKAVALHNTGGIALSLSYFIFFLGNIFSPNKKHYRLKYKGLWKDMYTQFNYYMFGVFKGQKHPFPVTEENKFNPLQKVSYVLIMYIALPLIIITGWGLLLPDITISRVFGVSGLILTDIIHIISGFIISIFMIIHIYLCTLGSTPGSLFKGMISGYHVGED